MSSFSRMKENEDGTSEKCRLIAISDDIPQDKRELHLPHGVPVALGRSPFTGIVNPLLSRTQVTATADCLNKKLHIKVAGANPSAINGFFLKTNQQHTAENGMVLELLMDNFRYEINFNSSSTGDKIKPTSKTKNYFTNDSEAKKPKIVKHLEEPGPSSHFFSSIIKRDNGKLFVYSSGNIKASNKIAAFDLDYTIIKPKSKNKFPKDKDDWQICYSNVPSKLKTYNEQNYKIVIFTNQKSTGKKQFNSDDFKIKLDNIFNKIGVPVQAFISTAADRYRKPVTGMWDALELMNDNIPIDKKLCFYCGDAAGREKDHSSSDLLFAENLNISFRTPEFEFQGIAEKPFKRPKFDPKTLKQNNDIAKLVKDELEILVMVGLQGSGKSTLTQKIISISKGKYAGISQDQLKSLDRCLTVAENFLKSRKSVIIDNTNLDVATRCRWTDMAKKYRVPARCIWLDIPFEHCMHNLFYRELTDAYHTKITALILNSSKKKFVPPSDDEKFREICKVRFSPEFKNENEKNLYSLHLLGW